MKVICIDSGDIFWCIRHGMIPLREGMTYTVRAKVVGVRGNGYLLEEIKNECNILNHPGIEPSYHEKRFIPLSEVDEQMDKIIESLATM